MKKNIQKKTTGSSELFRFCLKMIGLNEQKKVHDQQVGDILELNPSDCSHWKNGEKQIKSIFSIKKISQSLQIDENIIIDVINETKNSEQALWHKQHAQAIKELRQNKTKLDEETKKINIFTKKIIQTLNIGSAPVLLPEIIRYFHFISLQAHDIIQRQTRILPNKKNSYIIRHKKGEMSLETRMSLALDLATIILELERYRFSELGSIPDDSNILNYEKYLFVTNILIPDQIFSEEIKNTRETIHIIKILSKTFWVSEHLMSWHIQKNLEELKKEKIQKEIHHSEYQENSILSNPI